MSQQRRQRVESCVNSSEERAAFLRGVNMDDEPAGAMGQAAGYVYYFPP